VYNTSGIGGSCSCCWLILSTIINLATSQRHDTDCAITSAQSDSCCQVAVKKQLLTCNVIGKLLTVTCVEYSQHTRSCNDGLRLHSQQHFMHAKLIQHQSLSVCTAAGDLRRSFNMPNVD
jgi:hypothetical protein